MRTSVLACLACFALAPGVAAAQEAEGVVIRAAPPPPSKPPSSKSAPVKPAEAKLAAPPPPKAGSPHQVVDAGTRGPIQLTAAASADGQSTVVEALEVVGRAPGPAMWTVSRGESQVVVMGAYSPLPHALEWDHRRLDRALDGATAVYLPRHTVGVISGAGLLLTLGSRKLNGRARLPDLLGPERATRLQTLGARAHSDFGKVMTYKPAVAGYTLYSDFLRAAGFSQEKPNTTVERLAASRRVPVRALARVNVAPLLRSLEKLDERGQLACFDAFLSQTEQVSSTGTAAAVAWSQGRLHDLRAAGASAVEDVCLSGVPGSRAVLERGTADAAGSIEEALRRPGRSVAVVPIEYLTRADGVLDRLKAKGFEIGVPPI